MKQYENDYKCFDFLGPSPIDFDTFVSMFVDLNKIFIFFMDSNGEKIPDEIKKLLVAYKKTR